MLRPPDVQAAEQQKEMVPVVEWIESRGFDPTTINVATWDFSRAKQLRLEPFQKDILRHVLTPRADGRFPYRTIVWSQIKKSGKTQMAAMVGAWFADQVEAPNMVITAANDEEQSAGRIFGQMGPTLYRLGVDFPTSKNAKPFVRLDHNGTVVRAIPNNYAGEAGENYGITLWSELWAYTSERARRLYDELIPVPTRKNSIRWVETYAGFEDESDLLLELFLTVFKDTTERGLKPGARAVPGLEHITTEGRPACYEVPEQHLFVFWDHERRMPWQQGPAGDDYYSDMERELRLSTYIRLCQNRWQKSEGQFIPDDWWRNSLRLDGPTATEKMVIACDAAKRHDTVAMVGCMPKDENGRIRTGLVRAWDPKGQDISLRKTIFEEVLDLHEKDLILGPVWVDPTELHQLRLDLIEKGIPCNEFPQGAMRWDADTFLYKLYKQGKILNWDEPVLADHIRAAHAQEDKNQRCRLIKGSLSGGGKKDEGKNKIDVAVAQSMAAYQASLITVDPEVIWDSMATPTAVLYDEEY